MNYPTDSNAGNEINLKRLNHFIWLRFLASVSCNNNHDNDDKQQDIFCWKKRSNIEAAAIKVRLADEIWRSIDWVFYCCTRKRAKCNQSINISKMRRRKKITCLILFDYFVQNKRTRAVAFFLCFSIYGVDRYDAWLPFCRKWERPYRPIQTPVWSPDSVVDVVFNSF